MALYVVRVGLLSMIRLYWCPVPSCPILFYYIAAFKLTLPRQAYRPRPKGVRHRSPEEVESSKRRSFSSVNQYKMSEIHDQFDTVLILDFGAQVTTPLLLLLLRCLGPM